MWVAATATMTVLIAAVLFGREFLQRHRATERVLHAPVRIKLEFLVRYPGSSAVRFRDVVMDDRNGSSTSVTVIETATERRTIRRPGFASTEIPRLYDLLNAGGIWSVPSTAACGSGTSAQAPAAALYRVSVMLAGATRTHARTVCFGQQDLEVSRHREFHILLDEHRSAASQLPSLLTLQAASPRDPRYRAIAGLFATDALVK